MASPLATLFDAARGLGIFDFYLPFVLAFALFYGILHKVGIFGKDSKGRKLNIVISGILALFIIGYTPVGVTLSTMLSGLFGGTFIALVTILAALIILFMLMPLFGQRIDTSPKKVLAVFVLIAVILAVGIFIASGGSMIFPGFELPWIQLPDTAIEFPEIGLTSTDIAIIVMFIMTVGIIIWLYKEKEPSQEGRQRE